MKDAIGSLWGKKLLEKKVKKGNGVETRFSWDLQITIITRWGRRSLKVPGKKIAKRLNRSCGTSQW